MIKIMSDNAVNNIRIFNLFIQMYFKISKLISKIIQVFDIRMYKHNFGHLIFADFLKI